MWSHLKRTVFGITPQCWLWRIWVCWCWGRERLSTPLTLMISPLPSLRCRFDFLSFIFWQQHNRILSPHFKTAYLYSLYWFLSTHQVLWKVTEEKQKECTSKGKHPDVSKDLCNCHTCLKTHKHINGNTLNKGGCFSIWYQKFDHLFRSTVVITYGCCIKWMTAWCTCVEQTPLAPPAIT